jgi:hypothetical protein
MPRSSQDARRRCSLGSCSAISRLQSIRLAPAHFKVAAFQINEKKRFTSRLH